MQIEEGKYYKDREGNVHGPMRTGVQSHGDEGTSYKWDVFEKSFHIWTDGGVCDDGSRFDLIEEVAGPLPEGGSSVSASANHDIGGLITDIASAAKSNGYKITSLSYNDGYVAIDMEADNAS